MKKIKYNGKEYNQEKLCKEHDISVSTFRARLANGMTVAEALQKKIQLTCIICGKTFVSQRFGIKYCCKTCKRRGVRGKGAYKKYTRICVVCQRAYTTDRGYHNKTCSKHCRDQLTRIDRNKRYKTLKLQGRFDANVTLRNVFERFNGICQVCNNPLTFEVDCNSNDYPSIDHITPLSKGGGHTWGNVQLLCRGCNIAKGND